MALYALAAVTRPQQREHLMGWNNYLGNRCCTATVHHPDSLRELAACVKRLAKRGRIRPVGNSYAWMPLVPSEGSIISLGRLGRCLDTDPHAEVPSIRVECGMNVGQAEAHAAAAGLILCSPTMFNKVSVGGALATGSHGSDMAQGCFSDSLLSATVVTASGEVVEVSEREQLDALGVSFGCFGILYAVRLRCERSFAVFAEERWRDQDEFLEEMPELHDRVRFAQAWWFPHARKIGVKGMYPIDAPIPRRGLGERVDRWWRDRVAVMGANGPARWAAQWRPSLALPMFQIGESVAMKAGAGIRSARHEYHFHQGYMPCWDMSFAVPMALAADAWRKLIKHVLDQQDRGVFPVNIAVYARFVGASRCWMAANYQQPSCFLEVVSARGTPRVEAHFAAIASLLLELPSVRMHWGKHIPDLRPLLARYARRKQFICAQRHWDPSGVFLNDYLEQSVLA